MKTWLDELTTKDKWSSDPKNPYTYAFWLGSVLFVVTYQSTLKDAPTLDSATAATLFSIITFAWIDFKYK